MVRPIINLIKSTRVASGQFHSHVSMIDPKGIFCIDKAITEEFWESFADGVENNVVLGFAEKPQTFLPVLVDIDIKIVDINQEINEKIYDDEIIEEFISAFQSVLRTIIEDCTDTTLICALLEKPLKVYNTQDTTFIKNGFHLHFPYCFLEKSDQENHLIPRVKDIIKNSNILKKIGIEDSSSVIDNAVCRVPWLMYGCRKNPESDPYLFSTFYSADVEKISLEEGMQDAQIKDIEGKLIPVAGKEKRLLPRFLSISPVDKKVLRVKKNLSLPSKLLANASTSKDVKKKDADDEEVIKKNLEKARYLLPLISDERAKERNDWMTIGWCLYNISGGSEEGFELWCDFSSRDEATYDEANCALEWSKMVAKDLTLGTIKFFAKKDSPEEYKNMKTENVDKFIITSLEGSHNDIAKALYSDYHDEFICSSITNRKWYCFKNHIWQPIEEGTYLREKISEVLYARYKLVHDSLVKKLTENIEGDKIQNMINMKRYQQLSKMFGNLKCAPYKNNVMRECMEVFYNDKFEKKLNANPWLIAFQNGIYDLKNHVFRDGRPEDYISKAMPIDYLELSELDNRVQRVHKFLEQVFVDESIRTYFKRQMAKVFIGGNREKIIYFWTGCGHNGKSVTQSFFEKMFGPYSIKFSTKIITGKKPSSGQAHADLARSGDGVRWATADEPDKDEVINCGTLKHMTGNDTFFARDLFEKGKDTREIKPQFSFGVICNNPPKLNQADYATWSRIRVIPFESKFIAENDPTEKPPPSSYEEQLIEKRFPRDDGIEDQIPELLSAFAWVLLQVLKKNGLSKVPIPEKVMMATKYYQSENDFYARFIDEFIIINNDKSCILTMAEIYNKFKEWYRDSFPMHTIPTRIDAEEYFFKIKTWEKMRKGCKWVGMRIRGLNEGILEDENENSETENENENSENSESEKKENKEEHFEAELIFVSNEE